jgi:hypothetical protein
MKFSAVALIAAAAAGVSAHGYSNVTYTTEVVTALTTYCPEPTEITHGGKTWTITKATTLTITDCPCTISKPVYTSKVVECKTCGGYNSTSTKPVPIPTKPTGTGSVTTTKGTSVPTAGAAKLAGAGLAGFLGLAVFVL